jgi:peptidoglycan/xylan/chitin deacetylase (PgdA/CDA1 family)
MKALGLGIVALLLVAGGPVAAQKLTPSADLSPAAAAEAEHRPLLIPPRAVEMPILVYHHVVPGSGSSSEEARLLFVTPEVFEQQLKYLKDNGYQSVSFDDLADCLETGMPLPRRPVILSFDDGWENQFTYAFPLLQKYQFTATFYVVTNYLDHQNFMALQQLKTMMAAGMTIGGHSRSHPALTGLDTARRWDEIAASKNWLQERLGVTINTFAYPYGSYNPGVVALVKAAGYRTARTVDFGTHYTAGDLETLQALLFQLYIHHYRENVELAGEVRR